MAAEGSVQKRWLQKVCREKVAAAEIVGKANPRYREGRKRRKKKRGVQLGERANQKKRGEF